ncbi:MAG: outer membrane beta-barrel protein [Bdellovibrionales bacterium]|nr:outer membrane beta-barrel protein [Bdellovibrionales bacterium]
MKNRGFFLVFAFGLLLSSTSFAVGLEMPGSYLMAQTDPDEAYDPFTDYSEFDEASDEEADINFFRNGRFFTVGLLIGPRGYTEGMGKVYNQAPAFGLSISYFFDLRLAFALGLMTGDSSMNFRTIAPTETNYSGTLSLTTISMALKYYFNTQNVTKGLADLNPYFLTGFSQVNRTQTISTLAVTGCDTTTGVDAGLGLEIPLMRRKAYLGIQATYHYVSFADENREFIDDGGSSQKLEYKFNGDFYDMLFILGMNF